MTTMLVSRRGVTRRLAEVLDPDCYPEEKDKSWQVGQTYVKPKRFAH